MTEAPEGFGGWIVTEESAEKIVLKHADGRSLGIRVMDMADMLDLMEAAGSESTNQGWMNLAVPAVSVMDIDGTPVPFPKDRARIKDRARKLGNERMAAIIWALFHRAPPQADLQTAKN